MHYVFGDFCLDARKRTLTRLDGGLLALTPKLFDTLQFLLQHAGQDLDKDRLMEALWPGLVVEENNLSQAISGLRKLLGDDGGAHRYIVTVPRRGYRFVAEVRPADASPSPAPDAAPAPASPTAAPDTPAAMPLPPAAGARPRRRYLPAAIAAATVLVLVIAGWQWLAAPRGAAPPATSRTIAVLPFSNLGGVKEDEFFSEGITEDMVTQLAQIADLRVTSRASASRYKDSKLSLRDIAKELDVAYLLVGTVRRGQDNFRITAQLVDAQRDQNLWARIYDRSNADILAVQREVATEIATSLKGSLGAGEASQLAKRAKGDPEAFLAYLRGNYEMSRRLITRPDQYDQAPLHFQKAIALDPSSPLGYVGMGYYHFVRARLGYFDPKPNHQAAEGYLLKALALDDKSVEAHINMARLRGPGQWNWPEAEKEAKRAIELDPNNAQAWAAYSFAFLEPTGRLAEAVTALQRAVALEPVSAQFAWLLSHTQMRMGNCDEAMRLARINLSRDPGFTLQHTTLVACLERQGRLKEAIAENRLVRGNWLTDAFLDRQEALLAKEGPAGYWRIKYEHQRQLSTTSRADSWFYLATAAMTVGDKEAAYRALDEAIRQQDRHIIYIKSEWDLKPLHGEPRFQAALKKLNLQ